MRGTVSDPAVGRGRTVLVGPVRYEELCGSGRRLLVDAGFTLIENRTTAPWAPHDLEPLLPSADAAICGVEEYDAAMLAKAPGLRVISRLGVGLDNVDLTAARERGIDVVNAPGGNAAAVAELAVGLILSVLRRIPTMDRDIRAGRWDRYAGNELAGKTVGLVGFGATARLLARRLAGFDVTLLAFDPRPDPGKAAELRVRLTSLDEVVERADVLSLHAPHTPRTHHLVDAGLLGRMRPGAVLVNTSRGGLVDETALRAALESGRLAGAGLDVFGTEPTTAGHPLLRLANVVATPHAAADSEEAYERIGLSSAQAVIDVFAGRTPVSLAN
ncbi:phosphoglycerate dehydrogenase [Streptomyces paludis]|uniref:Phosphoglycerate dehydrogenase n=1 Tax=Streptomyces paludis TaxID=2282738 RepID=A0A345HY02_9ACTN|nr:phosphoglycerate dehydrogenase [Streptomyces paludis]AXG81576.1 phosphoglycerate dehydrogenase [Streptomyces paludis]